MLWKKLQFQEQENKAVSSVAPAPPGLQLFHLSSSRVFALYTVSGFHIRIHLEQGLPHEEKQPEQYLSVNH